MKRPRTIDERVKYAIYAVALAIEADPVRASDTKRRAYGKEREARSAVVIALRNNGYSYPEISELMGYRSHTSVMDLDKHGPPDQWVVEIAVDHINMRRLYGINPPAGDSPT